MWQPMPAISVSAGEQTSHVMMIHGPSQLIYRPMDIVPPSPGTWHYIYDTTGAQHAVHVTLLLGISTCVCC